MTAVSRDGERQDDEQAPGRTALVTGAGRGIGQNVAARFAERAPGSPSPTATCCRAERGRGAFPDAIAVGMDISDEGSVEAGFAAAAAHGFEIDVVVANAGVQLFGQDAKIADLDLDVWNRTVAINLTGTFLTVKHAVRAMLADGRAVKGGSIILTGSPTGLNGEGADFTAYSSTKAGMHGMARTVAAAYAADGIRVNTVVPGYTETPLVTAISGTLATAPRLSRGSRWAAPAVPRTSKGSWCIWPATNPATPPGACSEWTAA